jgi:hypothetical protein
LYSIQNKITKDKLSIMIKKYIWFFVILLSSCASIHTSDIKIDAQADPKANFSGYTTYVWMGAASIVNDPYGQWEPPEFDADLEIKFLIDRELRKRGMSENSANPDALVYFAAGINMEALELIVDPETNIDLLTTVPKGALVIALADSKSGQVIWIGVATGEVQESPDTSTVKARLNYAVKNLMKQLPK